MRSLKDICSYGEVVRLQYNRFPVTSAYGKRSFPCSSMVTLRSTLRTVSIKTVRMVSEDVQEKEGVNVMNKRNPSALD